MADAGGLGHLRFPVLEVRHRAEHVELVGQAHLLQGPERPERAGGLETITYPSGAVVTYSYGSVSQVISGPTYGAVKPEIGVTLRDRQAVPIMINREIKSGYWDYPINAVSQDARLVFICFFDWDQLGIRDNRYVRVLIDNWPSRPEAAGKHALVDSLYVRFVTRGE